MGYGFDRLRLGGFRLCGAGRGGGTGCTCSCRAFGAALGNPVGKAVQQGRLLLALEPGVQGAVVLFVVLVDLWLKLAGLAKDLRAQGVGVERLHVRSGRGRKTQFEEVIRGDLVGHQVGPAVGHAQVQHLNGGGTFPDRDLAGGFSDLRRVRVGGHQDGNLPVEHLVHTGEDQVLIVIAGDEAGDPVTTT